MAGSAAQRDTAFTQFFTLVVTFVGCAIVLLTVPRPAAPNTLPALSLDPRLLREAQALDLAQAAREPTDPQAIAELGALYLDDGRDDTRGIATQNASRRRELSHRAERLSAEDRDTTRVRTTQRALACLQTASCARDEREGLLGSFPVQTVRYGLRAESGRALAPQASVRAAYKMRWNMVHGRPQDEGLHRVEQQAFFGFLALHARSLPLPERANAAQAFYRLGGQRSAETYAVFLFQGGREAEGLDLMERAFEQRGELRLRNMTLAMALTLQAEDK